MPNKAREQDPFMAFEPETKKEIFDLAPAKHARPPAASRVPVSFDSPSVTPKEAVPQALRGTETSATQAKLDYINKEGWIDFRDKNTEIFKTINQVHNKVLTFLRNKNLISLLHAPHHFFEAALDLVNGKAYEKPPTSKEDDTSFDIQSDLAIIAAGRAKIDNPRNGIDREYYDEQERNLEPHIKQGYIELLKKLRGKNKNSG